MKKLLSLNLLIALAVVFASCGTNNNVVNNRLISKRKYNKGFHINRKGNMKSSKAEKEEESIAFEDVKSSNKKAKKAAYVSNRSEDRAKNVASTIVEEEHANAVVEDKGFKNNPIANTSDSAPSGDEIPLEEAQVTEDDQSNNDTSSSEQKMSKKEAKKMARSAASGGNSDLVNILLIVLLVLVILALISWIGGTLGWILSVVVLVLIIYFLLKLLGAI